MSEPLYPPMKIWSSEDLRPAMTHKPEEVTEAEAIKFLENAFRNIDLPPLDSGDMADIRRALASAMRAASPPPDQDQVEAVARAIYDAPDSQSGDYVGTVIWNSEHLFYDNIADEEIVDRAWRVCAPVCRDAARAAITAMKSLGSPGDGWLPIESAPKPKDGPYLLFGQPEEEGEDCQIWIGDWDRGTRLSIRGSSVHGEYLWGDATHWQPLPAPPSADLLSRLRDGK